MFFFIFNVVEFDFRFELLDNMVDFGLELINEQGEVYWIGYNVVKSMFYSDCWEVGDYFFFDSFVGKFYMVLCISEDRIIYFQFYLDVVFVELFVDEGVIVMIDIFFLMGVFEQVVFYVENGQVKLLESSVYFLKSIW